MDGIWPIYEVHYQGKRFAFCKGRLGAPACVGCFEEVIALGARRIILLGNCGVLDRSIQDCGIIIPTRAIRDEGTSYHYVPAANYIDVNRKYVDDFIAVLDEFGYPHIKGTTWTTDAFYRETREKIETRKKMGLFVRRWSVQPCRLCAIFGAWSISSSSMRETIWITLIGTHALWLDRYDWMIKKRSPCWLSSWQAGLPRPYDSCKH